MNGGAQRVSEQRSDSDATMVDTGHCTLVQATDNTTPRGRPGEKGGLQFVTTYPHWLQL